MPLGISRTKIRYLNVHMIGTGRLATRPQEGISMVKAVHSTNHIIGRLSGRYQTFSHAEVG